ncbi:MAG: SUMF1/EgtB/PvdO family nonheme iron enzyme [Proteobacteria bacterium]|nr:SUMF1/EgtB/PvdO family nonheme iron enzyme [Pseudomonadota bacterium]
MHSRQSSINETHTPMLVVPDSIAEEDRIGHQQHCDGLVQMIRSVKSSGSFTIGVYGQWGSGKTSMLKLIERALCADAIDSECRTLTVWFNPWQFAGEEHLIIPFFHTLAASLKRIHEKLKEDKGDFSKKVSVFLKKLTKVPIALAYGLEGEIKIPLLLKSKFSFKDMIDESRRAEKEINLKEREKEEGIFSRDSVQEYESLYYNLLQELQESAKEFGTKIVVFIDDLDRCLPEKAVQLLEGLKVLLDLPSFVFVIGVAREVIERGIRVRYRELYLTNREDLPDIEKDYLDKIVQFPVAMPPADPKHLESHITSLMNELKDAQPFIKTILETLGNNPRTLKRFINAISFSMWVAARKQVEDCEPFLPELLIKMSLIAFLLPNLYRQLENYPHHLIKLQRIIRQLGKTKIEKTEEDRDKFHEPTKTNIPLIDRWLEELHLSKLEAILRPQERELAQDKGFADEEEVKRYVFMLAPALNPETRTKVANDEIRDPSLAEELKGRMVKIAGGTFTMGDKEEGEVETTVSDFEIDKYPVTQSLYYKVIGKNPSHFKGDDKPVEHVSWFDAVKFCNNLSEKMGYKFAYATKGGKVERINDANGFRLLTEAEWEYACRAGSKGERHGDLDSIAWYDKNSGGETHGVGQKDPNKWGLYDILGNVWEWCQDWYGDYPSGHVKDPPGPSSGSFRVIRGGSWGRSASFCRSAIRGGISPDGCDGDIGFRLSRSVSIDT